MRLSGHCSNVCWFVQVIVSATTNESFCEVQIDTAVSVPGANAFCSLVSTSDFISLESNGITELSIEAVATACAAADEVATLDIGGVLEVCHCPSRHDMK